MNSSTTPSESGNLRPYHCHVRLDLVRGRQQAGQALGIAGQAGGFFTDAAIPRQAIHLLHARRLAQLPHQRVLPASSANNQDLHRRTLKIKDKSLPNG